MWDWDETQILYCTTHTILLYHKELTNEEASDYKLSKQNQQLCKRPKEIDSIVLSYLSVSFSLSALSSRPTSSFISPGRSLRRPPPFTV